MTDKISKVIIKYFHNELKINHMIASLVMCIHTFLHTFVRSLYNENNWMLEFSFATYDTFLNTSHANSLRPCIVKIVFTVEEKLCDQFLHHTECITHPKRFLFSLEKKMNNLLNKIGHFFNISRDFFIHF